MSWIQLIALLAGVESKYIDIAAIRDMADKMILASENPSGLVVELSRCTDTNSAANLFREEIRLQGHLIGENYGKLLVGFLYLSHLKGIVDRKEMEAEIIDVIDAYSLEDLDAETCYLAFSEKSPVYVAKIETFVKACAERSVAVLVELNMA